MIQAQASKIVYFSAILLIHQLPTSEVGKTELEGVVFPSRGKKSNFAAFAPEGVREAALQVQFTPPFGTGILTVEERTEVKHGPRVRQNSFNNSRFAVSIG